MGACKPCTRRAGERLKCVLQIQESPSYKGVKYNGYKELVNGLYKEGGVMGICRGSGITSRALSLAPYRASPPLHACCVPRRRCRQVGTAPPPRARPGSALPRAAVTASALLPRGVT